MPMSAWEVAMGELKKNMLPAVNHQYELRPGEKGPSIFCSTCGTIITKEFSAYLDELVAEAAEHEKKTHNR